MTRTKNPYFLGSIILKKGRTLQTWEDYSDCKIVIDGQQRLTTLIIFMKALCLKKKENQLFERDFILENNQVALRHGKNDIDAFQKVIRQTEPELLENKEPKSQIIEAYNYFIEHIKDTSLYNRTVIKQNIQFVCIDLVEEEDEQQVFDTINSLGVKLTTAELLKNYFFDENNVDEYNKNWAAVFEKDDETKAYWDMAIPSSFGMERMNVILFGLKNTTTIPYILYIARNVTDKREFNQMCGILESYIMRRMVVHATTKNYNHLFTSLILNGVLDADSLSKKLKEGKDSTTYIPNDTDMKNSFHTAKLYNIQTKGILYLIESGIRAEGSSTALLGFNKYSMELLMPKKWRNHWPPCATEELAKARDAEFLTLGNLAIIPQSLNASIRDADWQTKKAGKNEKPGLAECAGGLNTLLDVLKKDEWNEDEIAARAEWLYKKGIGLWNNLMWRKKRICFWQRRRSRYFFQ